MKMTSRSGTLEAAAFALLAGLGLARAQERPLEPEGYRMEAYRAPTPATLRGARVLTTADVKALAHSGAVSFIDVLPQVPRPANLGPDVVWRAKPRFDIPGSVWLPDTGYGELAEPTLDYFVRGVAAAEKGGSPRLLVFYCLRDCWMSWNAAKRALSLGHKDVAWYPDGTDGWSEAGLPLEERAPEPRP